MTAPTALLGSALVVAASGVFAGTLASSSFDDGRQGWIAGNGAQEFHWFDAGGDPYGFIQAKDSSGQTLWFFSAPSAYLGDKLAAYGGALSFALKSASSSPPLAAVYADVHLLGSNGVRLVYSGGGVPADHWTPYSILLVADGSWKVDSVSGADATAADFAGVLSNVTDLRIRGDYRQAIETTGLDSVLLASAVPTQVPEPGTLALWFAGLVAVTVIARRRKS